MDIKYTFDKCFMQDDVVDLFLSINWVSGEFPTRLYKALLNSSTVVTAWDNSKLVGLARAIDDSEMTAYVHYVLVRKEYERQGIASNMMKMILNKYKNYVYVKVIPANDGAVKFYDKLGFKKHSIGMQVENFSDKR